MHIALKGHLARTSLYTKVRRRYCFKVLKIDVQQADPLLVSIELASYLVADRA